MTKATVWTISILLLGLAGCSNRGVYDTLQAAKRSDCQRQPEPDRTRCLDSTTTNYEDYERERTRSHPP